MIDKKQHSRRLLQLSIAGVVVIFVALPFTTPISVLLGATFGYYELFTLLEEVLLLLVAVALLVSGSYKTLLQTSDRRLEMLVWCVLAYAGWVVLSGLINLKIGNVNGPAFLQALIVDTRFMLFFLVCYLVALQGDLLRLHWRKLLLVPATVVVAFALLQIFVLQPDVLKHLGYGPDTVAAFQAVDQKPEFARVQSTLRGPNPLGVYLILIIAAVLVGFRGARWKQISLLLGSGIVLFYTYSRSAWLGLVATLGVIVWLGITNRRLRQWIVAVGVGLVVLLAGGAYIARDSNFVQNTLLHTDETSLSPESSNASRARGLQQGASEVLHEPFGRGPGSAGPASVHNNHPERIAENYFLQIGQETGWVGLGLFVAIMVFSVLLLWERRQQPLAKILLASLVGITVASMVSHAWADDTIAFLWWGLAGVAIATIKPTVKHA